MLFGCGDDVVSRLLGTTVQDKVTGPVSRRHL